MPPLQYSLLSGLMDLFLQSFFTGLLGGRSMFAFVCSPMHLPEDLYIPVSEPAGICHSHSTGLPTLSSTLGNPLIKDCSGKNRLGNQTDLELNSSSCISSEALDKLFNLPESV